MTSVIPLSSPVETVKAFIACIGTKDLDHMRQIIHPKATACLIRDNEPRFQALAEAIDRLGKAEEELVEVSGDEVEHIDGDYATVWATFSMQRNGEASGLFARACPADRSDSIINLARSHTRVGKALFWAGSS